MLQTFLIIYALIGVGFALFWQAHAKEEKDVGPQNYLDYFTAVFVWSLILAIEIFDALRQYIQNHNDHE